jgi:thiol:disulfide interchange protein DsbD
MAHFKTLMAFPMFATVVWLVWVLGQQTGIDGAAALLLILLALAFLAWALGSPTLGPRARVLLGGLSVVAMAAALIGAAPALRPDAASAVGNTADGRRAAGDSPTAVEWQPWSAERVAHALAAGQPVFVDFTAAWCVTCQVNKRAALASTSVRAAFVERSVLLLRADWTRRDPAISAELARLGRSGVPVYALYAPGAQTPRLLSELLSVGEVRDAIEALPRS